MGKQSLKKIIEKAVREYNKYRSPEATASIVLVDEKSIKIEFTGSYCVTCGFYDYFDDFRYTLEDLGIKSRMDEIAETDNGAVVTFLINA